MTNEIREAISESSFLKADRLSISKLMQTGSISDIEISTDNHDGFKIVISASNPQAAPIEIRHSSNQLAVSAGRYFWEDVEESSGGMSTRWAFALNLVTMIIEYGMCERAELVDNQPIAWQSEISTPHGLFKSSWKKHLYRRSKSPKQVRYDYQPYSQRQGAGSGDSLPGEEKSSG